MLRAAFLVRPDGLGPASLALRAVQLVTGRIDRAVHCELLFSDSASFSSAPFRGTCLRRLDPDPATHAGWWDVFDLPGLDEARARTFAERECGRHYGWASILGYPLNLESRTSWMCAESVANAAYDAGGPRDLLDYAGSPAALHAAMRHVFVDGQTLAPRGRTAPLSRGSAGSAAR